MSNLKLIPSGLDDLQKKFVLRHCHKLAADYLAERLELMLQEANEVLVNCAVNARDDTIQKVYFDSVRTLYVKRGEVRQRFLQGYCRGYYHEVKPDGWAGCEESEAQQIADHKFALEENVLISDQLSAVNGRYQATLRALAGQFAEVMDGVAVGSSEQPLAMNWMSYAFRDALGSLEMPFAIKRHVYTLWQQQVLEKLAPLYNGINSYLYDEHGLGERAGELPSTVPGAKATDTDVVDYVPSLIAKLVQGDQDQSRQAFVRDQITRVQQIVAAEMADRQGETKLPEGLAQAWNALLVGIYLEEGHDSLRWHAALAVTDDLIWSLQPKQDAQERQHLVKMIPHLLRAIRDNLDELTWQDIDLDSIFSELEACHIANLRGAAANDLG